MQIIMDNILEFNILRENGAKVKARKCKLFQKQINYLGRTISGKGYGIGVIA